MLKFLDSTFAGPMVSKIATVAEKPNLAMLNKQVQAHIKVTIVFNGAFLSFHI